MQTYRFRTLLLFVICFSLCRGAMASSVVQSEFEMLLPRSFQQNLIEQEWRTLQSHEFKFSWMLPDQTFDTPDVKVLLAGLKLDLSTRLERPDIGSGGETVLLQSRGLEADLSVQSIAIDQWITREVGGVIGRFRVQAKCEDVQLHMKPGKALLTMQLSPVFDGALLRARVDDANLTWTPDAWEIVTLNCTGAEGFDDVVRAEIYKRTGDASIVTSQKATLMEYVRGYVSSHTLDLSKSRRLITARPDILVSMQVTDFSGTKVNAVLRGVVRVEFTRQRTGDSVFVRLSGKRLSSSSTAVIRVPEDLFLAVAKQLYAGNTWTDKIYSNEISGFQSLMQSRFAQFFVWRELIKYPKSSKFLFEVYSPKDVSVTGKNLSYDVKAPLFSKMSAPREGELVPFMNFSVPMSSKVNLTLNNSVVKAKFSNVSLGLQEQWDPSYVAKYSPSRVFAREKIRQRIQRSVQGFTVNYALPSIPVSDETALVIQKAAPNKSGDLILYLQETSTSPKPKDALPTAAQ